MTDIKDLIQVTTGAPVTAVEEVVKVEDTADVTGADVGEKESQVEGESPALAKEAEAKEEEVATQDSESKSKDERKEEGTKIEKKIGRLKKVSAENIARAEKAERELLELRRQIEEQKNKSNDDLDSLSFDERVKKVARDSVENERMSEKERQLTSEIQSVQAEEWSNRLDDAKQSYDDFDSVLKSAKDVYLPDMVLDAIKNSEVGGHLLYEICKDSEVAEKLARMKNPLNASTILFKMEQSIENRLGNFNSESEEVKPQSVAPTPKLTPTPTNQGRAPIHPLQLDMEQFINMRKQNGTLR